MTAFLFEGQRTVYIVLGIVLVLLLLSWWQTRKRALLVAAAIVVGLIGLYWLLDFLVETEQEADRAQMQARIEAMAHAVAQKDTERLFRHISEKFTSPQGKSRSETYAFARQVIQSGTVTEVRVWSPTFAEPPERSRGEATMNFSFKVIGSNMDVPFSCDATFEWAGSRGWLLKKVALFTGIGQPESPF